MPYQGGGKGAETSTACVKVVDIIRYQCQFGKESIGLSKRSSNGWRLLKCYFKEMLTFRCIDICTIMDLNESIERLLPECKHQVPSRVVFLLLKKCLYSAHPGYPDSSTLHTKPTFTFLHLHHIQHLHFKT